MNKKKILTRILTVICSLLVIFCPILCLNLFQAGTLGDYYFINNDQIVQKLHLSITNEATLTTYSSKDDTISNVLKTEWQHAVTFLRDEYKNPLYDENGHNMKEDMINLIYYVNGQKRTIQFIYKDGTLEDLYKSTEFNMYRTFIKKGRS